MAVFRPKDRELLTVLEFALIEASRPGQIKAFTIAQLKSKITRARKYWDKYRERGRQQQRVEKKAGVAGMRPMSNARTDRKARIFALALSRFEKRLAQVQRRESPKTHPRAKPPRMETDSRATQREKLRKEKQRHQAVDESALTKRIARQFQKSKRQAIQGHVRASGARRQGKRDAR